MDATRKDDLEELDKARREAPNSYYRDYYEKKMYKILQETADIASLRGDLVKAVRHNDQRAIHSVSSKIHYIRNTQTNGHLDH